MFTAKTHHDSLVGGPINFFVGGCHMD